MAEVRWTPQAADDLDAIAEFIAKNSPHHAAVFVMDDLQSVEQLMQFSTDRANRP